MADQLHIKSILSKRYNKKHRTMRRFVFFGPRVVLEDEYERRKRLSKMRIDNLLQELSALKAEKKAQEEAYRRLAEEVDRLRAKVPTRDRNGRFSKRS